MKILYKTKKNIKNASSILFGLKGFSTYENEISLEEIKNYQDKELFLAIDKNIFNSDLEYLEKIIKEIDNYNLKGILFYDLAVLSLAKKHNIKTPLIWSQDFLVANYQTCNYYQKEGVKGALISSCLTIEEIEEICKNVNLDTFVYGFGYQMMAFSKRHLVTNYFEYINDKNDKEINYMIEREVKYPVVEKRNGTKFLSNDILNSIKYINRLKERDVKYLIIDDYLIEDETFCQVADIFEKCVSNDINEDEIKKMEEKINQLLPNSSTIFLDKKTIYKVKRK